MDLGVDEPHLSSQVGGCGDGEEVRAQSRHVEYLPNGGRSFLLKTKKRIDRHLYFINLGALYIDILPALCANWFFPSTANHCRLFEPTR